MSDCPKLQTGDIVCFGDSSRISRLIKWFTRHGDEPATKCSHVGIMYDEDRVCEAVKRVVITAIMARLGGGGWREIYRPIILSAAEQLQMQEQCEYYKGKSYGWWKNIAQAADGLIGGRYFFRRLCRMDDYPICSARRVGFRACHRNVLLRRAAERRDAGRHTRRLSG